MCILRSKSKTSPHSVLFWWKDWNVCHNFYICLWIYIPTYSGIEFAKEDILDLFFLEYHHFYCFLFGLVFRGVVSSGFWFLHHLCSSCWYYCICECGHELIYGRNGSCRTCMDQLAHVPSSCFFCQYHLTWLVPNKIYCHLCTTKILYATLKVK